MASPANPENSASQEHHERELAKYDWEIFANRSSSGWLVGFFVTLVVLLMFRAWFSMYFAAWRGTPQFVLIDTGTYLLMTWVGVLLFSGVALRIHRSLQEAQLSREKPVPGRLKCPHCGALYLYSESSVDVDDTVECQNCATRFAMPRATLRDW